MSFAFISEWLAAIAATVFYFKYKHLPIRLVRILLWITVIAESGARIWIKTGYDNNHWIYNGYALAFYVLMFKMVYDHVQDKKRKSIIGWLSILFIVGSLIRACFVSAYTQFLVHANNIGMVVLVIALLIYAVDILKSDRALRLKTQLELFIFSGYLFFGIAFIPLSLFVFGGTFQVSRETLTIFSNMQQVIVVIMYLIFTFGFIWTRPQMTER